MGDFEGETDWHGGRIIQIARLFKQQNGDICIQLEGLEYQRASTRFSRFLGSRRILRVNVSSDLLYDEEKVRSFFLKKFVLCGRVFVPLRPKDSKVYLVEIREDHERSPNAKEGDDRRLSFEDIVKWHNPLGTNRKQVNYNSLF
jgi:RNA-dependent RNA polymerase